MNVIENTIEGNKLIHIWMGKSYETDTKIMILKYHTSWDWLHPVIDKLRELPNNELVDEQLLEESDEWQAIKSLRIWADIETVWYTVINLISWYNTTSPTKK